MFRGYDSPRDGFAHELRPPTPELRPRPDYHRYDKHATAVVARGEVSRGRRSFPRTVAVPVEGDMYGRHDLQRRGERAQPRVSRRLSVGSIHPVSERHLVPESVRAKMRRFMDIILPSPSKPGIYITREKKGNPTNSEAADIPKLTTRASVRGYSHADSSKRRDHSSRRFSTPATARSSCLLCRDFTAVDAHASSLPNPRHRSSTSIPSDQDLLTNLARALTHHFPARVDKARAIFTWLHHNISYDIASYVSRWQQSRPRRRPRQSPRETIQTGVAMCGGYAELYNALARAAGLEAMVIIGICNLGRFPVAARTQIPTPAALWEAGAGHAWNAVRLDDADGGWKVVDSCWGAGYVADDVRYVKKFRPRYFAMSNVEFASRHFPLDSAKRPAPDRFFFPPGVRTPSWEEFVRCDYDYVDHEPVTGHCIKCNEVNWR